MANRYAIYFVSGKYGLDQFECYIEAESAEDAENIAYDRGIDCDGSCYEDYDEDEDYIEPECNCGYKAELVVPDAVYIEGRMYSKFETLQREVLRMRNIIKSYPQEILKLEQEIELLKKEVEEKREKLYETERGYRKKYEETKTYLEEINERREQYDTYQKRKLGL